MIKKSYAVSMTYQVSDEEKKQAERALICFNYSLKLLDKANVYLNIMKTPFKDNPQMSSQEIIDTRAAIRRFRDRSIKNFNEFKTSAFKCVQIMTIFNSDTQTVKLMKSFISAIDTLESAVNFFNDLFEDLEAKDFSTKVVTAIESIQQECDSVEEIVDERIKTHLQNNILSKNWVDSVSDELQLKIEQKTPLIIDLFNKRQDQLNEIIKEKK